MTKTRTDYKQRALELSVALEITKFQRDAYREQVAKLEQRLTAADQRAERAEERLHGATLKISNIAMQVVSAPLRSTATEVLVDGKSILRLNNPVNLTPSACT
jgi:chromosome segregation ATPase